MAPPRAKSRIRGLASLGSIWGTAVVRDGVRGIKEVLESLKAQWAQILRYAKSRFCAQVLFPAEHPRGKPECSTLRSCGVRRSTLTLRESKPGVIYYQVRRGDILSDCMHVWDSSLPR